MRNHTMTRNLPRVNTDACGGCGVCIDICPVDAIGIENGVATINASACRGCYACQTACPMNAIE